MVALKGMTESVGNAERLSAAPMGGVGGAG